MESKRPPAPSSEAVRSAADMPFQPVEAVSKDAKTKKASLPASAILNTKPEADNLQVNTDKGSEKNGWDVEALFGAAEHKEEGADEAPNESEKLSESEAREVVSEYVEDRSETVEAELTEANEDSPIATIAAANQVLLEKLRTQAQASEQPTDEIITEATQATIEELHLTENEAEDTPPDHAKPLPIVAPHPTKVRQQEAVIASILAEEKPKPESSEEQPDTMPMPVSDDLMRAVQHTGGSHSGSAESHVPSVRPKPETSADTGFTRRDVAAGVLVGGVAGYMVGRKSGRKRAEAAAKPAQEKLLAEVDTLQKKIIKNEQLVRSLAAQKVAKEHASQTAPQAAYEQFAPEPRREVPRPQIHESPAKVTPPETQASHAPHSMSAEQSVPIPSPKQRLEQLATSGAEPTPVAKQPQPRQEQVRAVMAIEKMPLEDVLVIAKNVNVEGESLESYYKQGRLTERAVRTILVEQRRTGRVERAFYKHLNLHETHVRASAEIQTHDSKPAPNSSGHARFDPDIAAHLPHTSRVSAQKQPASPSPASHSVDRIHADNTPRIGMTATIGVILAVIFAFFLARILFS
jgi:hypothetical protein